VVGVTPIDLLEKYKKQSSHMDLNFPEVKEPSGIEKLLPKDLYSAEVADLITNLLKHHPEDRLSASKTLDHPWFKELREQDKILLQQQ
jgi:serine/threonine protein kinase